MEIKHTGLTGLTDPYGRAALDRVDNRVDNRAGSHASQGAAAAQADTVSVSEEAVLRTEAYRSAMGAPDVRQDKINAIKDRIASGTYEINPHRIAANILRDDNALYS